MPKVSEYASTVGSVSKVKQQLISSGAGKSNVINPERLYDNTANNIEHNVVGGTVVSTPIQIDPEAFNFVKSDNGEVSENTKSNSYKVVYYYSTEKSQEIQPPSKELLALPETDPKYQLFIANLAQGIGGGRIIMDSSKEKIPSRGDKISIQSVKGDHAFSSKVISIDESEDVKVSQGTPSLKKQSSDNSKYVSRADSTKSDSFPDIDITSGDSPYPKAFKITLPPAVTNQGVSVEYDKYIKKNGTLAWRNNNPGNMRLSKPPHHYGALSRDSKKFLQFPTEKDGFDALLIYIKTWKKATLKEFMYNYAPPSENSTDKYLNGVAADIKASIDTKMADLTDQQRYKLALAIKKREGWTVGKIEYKNGGTIESVGVI